MFDYFEACYEVVTRCMAVRELSHLAHGIVDRQPALARMALGHADDVGARVEYFKYYITMISPTPGRVCSLSLTR